MYDNHFIESKLIPLCALLMGLGVAVSTALMSASYILMVVLVIATGIKDGCVRKTFQNKYVLTSVLFFCLIIVGISWSNAPITDRVKMTTRLIEYALVPLLFIGIQTGRSASYLIKSFVFGAVLSATLSIFAYTFNYPILQGRTDTIFYWTVFRGHLLHDVFLAIASNFILWRIFERFNQSRNVLILLVIIYLICFFDVMFLVQGRTGEVMLLAMNAVLILFRFRLKGLVYGGLIVAVILPLLFVFAPAVKSGVNSYSNDQVQLEQGNTDTSTGLRHQFHHNSWILIKQSPIIGFGTGGFTNNYSSIVKGTNQIVTNNPHCDWLLIAVQWGGLGILLFVLVLVANIKEILKLNLKHRALGMSLFTGYLIATSQNSFFMDNVTGLAYMFLTLSLLSLGSKCNRGV